MRQNLKFSKKIIPTTEHILPGAPKDAKGDPAAAYNTNKASLNKKP
jgi:hypothetical protein